MIHFDKGLVFNSAKFPGCTEAQVLRGDAACAKAKIGSGKAAGLAVGQREDMTVTAYNGTRRQGGAPARHRSPPLNIDSVIVGQLKPDSGAFGRKLVVAIPANLQQPLTGLYATLTSFLTNGGRQRQGHALRRAEGLLGWQAQVQGRLRLHRRFQAVADLDGRLHEVARLQRPTLVNGRAFGLARSTSGCRRAPHGRNVAP